MTERDSDGVSAAIAGPARLPSVSIVIPARDSEATIAEALESALAQDYAGPVEIIVADGSDRPSLSETIRRRWPSVRVVPNPDRTLGPGCNAALRESVGDVVVRCDAHTVLPPGYIRRAVETLERTGAANVGGRQVPVGTTHFERAVALAMGSWLGSGGARHRVGGAAGPVDTVFLGVFRRKALEAVGGYDPVLDRNQDYELNWRLRQRGEIVWFDPELSVRYRPRGTLRKLAMQHFDYGRWKRVVLRRHPGSWRARHLAAPLLTLGLAASAAFVLAGAYGTGAALPLAYFATLIFGSSVIGVRRRELAALLLPLVLATSHLSWGAGFLFPARVGNR